MDLTNFSSKLEPFLLIAKSAKGAAAARLIEDATAAPGVFVFGELLELPNIQELGKNEQYKKQFALLELFAYRTYEDYLKEKNSLPSLNKAQITKIKYLTIVSLAAERRILPYADLLEALEISSVRELEDLIIDAIYLDILHGKLDQKEEQLEVTYTMGRDLEPGKLEGVLASLNEWASTTSAVLSTLDGKLNSIAAQSAAHKKRQQEYEKQLQTNLKEAHEKHKDKSLAGANTANGGERGSGLGRRGTLQFDRERENMMDVDELDIRGKGRKFISQDLRPLRKKNKF